LQQICVVLKYICDVFGFTKVMLAFW